MTISESEKRKAAREERLQAQLRDNLKRRKEQARARRGVGTVAPETAVETDDDVGPD